MHDAPLQYLEPGNLVNHPAHPEWGLGQVQSVIDARITVNFEHVGKVVIDGTVVILRDVTDHHASGAPP